MMTKITPTPSSAHCKAAMRSAEEWVTDILSCFQEVAGIGGYEKAILIGSIIEIQQDAIASQRSGPEGVPDGWQLVPMEPTKEMLSATARSMRFVDNAIGIARLHGCCVEWVGEKPPLHWAYKAMLAAAPKPEGEA
jgi:hypothetical protein